MMYRRSRGFASLKFRSSLVVGALALCAALASTGGDASVAGAAPGVLAPEGPGLTYPPPRQDASMAFDDATQTMVLFGGGNCNAGCVTFGDTWTWNGSTWIRQHPPTSPPPRAGATMAYDPITRTVLLFGGQVCDAQGCYWANDTWAWNGTTWTAAVPLPPRPTPTLPPTVTVTATGTPVRTPTSFPPTSTPYQIRPTPTPYQTPTSFPATPTPAQSATSLPASPTPHGTAMPGSARLTPTPAQ